MGPDDEAALSATVERLRDEVDGLRQAMRSRAVIEQAKGMLMLIYRIDADRAFEILRWRSGTTNTKLRTLAQQVSAAFRDLPYGERLPSRSVYDNALLTAHERVAAPRGA